MFIWKHEFSGVVCPWNRSDLNTATSLTGTIIGQARADGSGSSWRNTKRTWKERMQMDVWYIVNWSILLDFEILYMTLGVVRFGEHLRESFFTRKITDGSFRILANQGEKSSVPC